MSGADPYEAWRKQRSDVEVAPGFADRVMRAVGACERPPADAEASPPRGFRFASHYAAAAALLLVSVVAAVLRIESVVALILVFSSEGF
ncbi:MAG TPA: hypothetical protein VMY37_31825 [Thermoguttaceae bacterium]|nr:hypothetical protein [Thermoguttaceae bacterium]